MFLFSFCLLFSYLDPLNIMLGTINYLDDDIHVFIPIGVFPSFLSTNNDELQLRIPTYEDPRIQLIKYQDDLRIEFPEPRTIINLPIFEDEMFELMRSLNALIGSIKQLFIAEYIAITSTSHCY